MKIKHIRIAMRVFVITVPFLAGGCGGGDIDAIDVNEGSVTSGQATTYREGGKMVTGTVVKRNADGEIRESMDYVDGYPNGQKKVWYDNGQLKSEASLIYKDYGRSTGFMNNGPARQFCENGTLREERIFNEEGAPVGQHRSWTCTGELLTVNSFPSGEYRQASEMDDGSIWVSEEGFRTEAGKWEGEHRRYHQNGNLSLVEHWKDGALDGSYEEWDAAGTRIVTGHYAAGERVGTWITVNNGYTTVQDYDVTNFANLDYAGPFMQAAGIQPSNSGWGAKLPLKDYRVDAEKIRYYVTEGLIDPRKKLHVGNAPTPFVSTIWTYPYIHASRGALDTLVELGADPKAVDSDKRSRLHHCIFSLDSAGVCSVAEIKRLIDLGLAVDEPDVGDFTPLLDLVELSWAWRWAPTPEVQLEVAKLLLDAGADPDRLGGKNMLAQKREGLSPLMAAVNAKRFDLAALLLERSKNPAATHKLGYNLIHFVFLDRNLGQFDLRMKDDARAFIEFAVAKGVDPSASLEGVGTLKEVAQRAGAIELSKFLTELSATK